MASERGWWALTATVELDDYDRKHIAGLVGKGFTEGEVLGKPPTSGVIPSSWIGLTGMMKASSLLELLNAVDKRGVAHDDTEAVSAVWRDLRGPTKRG
jgi:hypothetical protein